MPRTIPAPRISFLHKLHNWVFSSHSPASRYLGWLQALLRVLFIMQREFIRTNIHIRAAALTYGLALALVPTLALSTAIFKGVGSDVHIKAAIFRLIEQLEPRAQTQPPPDDAFGDAEVLAPDDFVSDAAYLHRGMDLVFEYVDKTNFAALGLIGVLGLLVIFVLLLSSFEEAMNAIWHCHQRRPLLRRLMDYLALFILLPLSLNIAVAAEAILASDQLMAQLHLFLPSSWPLTFFVKLTTFAFIVLSLMAMYMFFPSDKVQTSAALAGALFAAFFWFLFQRLYIVLQIGVSKYNAIYGSFATVPLVLVSLNLGIVFILLGASLTHAIQYRNHYGFITRELAPQRQLQMAFDVLTIVYHNFSQRIPTTIELLQKSLPAVRPSHIEEIVDLLVSGNLLQQNADNTDMVIPVTSAEQLRGSEVVELVLGNDSLDTPGGALAQKALRAAADSLHGNLLAAMRQAMGHHQDGQNSEQSFAG